MSIQVVNSIGDNGALADGSVIPIWPLLLAAACVALCAVLIPNLLRTMFAAYRVRFSDSVGRQLARSHLFIDPQRLLVANLAICLVVTALAWVSSGSFLLAVLAALTVGAVPKVCLAVMRLRRRQRFRLQLSDLLMLSAGGLRAGLSLSQSLAQTAAEIDAPARQEVELMLREQRLGASFDQALAGLERRMPLEETALLCAALRISRETGGNLAETLEALGDAMRRKVAIEEKIRALTAQGRLQGWAMGLLPILCAALLFLVEPVAMTALFTTWYGISTCAAVLVMQMLGLHFMRRVMRIDV
jgi:tight adherence protein B